MSNKKKVTLKKEDLGPLVVTYPTIGGIFRQPVVFPPGAVIEECEGMIRVKHGRNYIAYFNNGEWGSLFYAGALHQVDEESQGKEFWA